MLTFADFDGDLVHACVDEFSAAAGIDDVFHVSCLYRSADFGNERMVFTLVRQNGAPLVLKLDTAENTRRLTKEFRILEKLTPYFEPEPQVAVVAPLYLSPGGHFHVTRFENGTTAKQKVYSDCDALQAGQVYRRSGAWLNHLHGFEAPQLARAHLDWMLEEIDTRARASCPQAAPATLSAYLRLLEQDVEALARTSCTAVFSHGDFHGGNLILGRGVTHGLDFTETCTKLAVYDIVDLLKMDVFRPAEPDGIGAGGIRHHALDMFFRKYALELSRPLLACCLRGRLLIEYAKVTRDAYERSCFQRRKLSALETRLAAAFAQPLDA